METPRDLSLARRPPPQRALQGPKPTPLRLKKYSHKFKKPPRPAQPAPPPPVITYDVSPKVIHTNPSDFMSLVQRLTGPDSGPTTTSTATTGVEMTKLPLPREVDTTVARLIKPVPATLHSPIVDPSPFVNLYHQGYLSDVVSHDPPFRHHVDDFDQFESGCGDGFLSLLDQEFLTTLLELDQ